MLIGGNLVNPVLDQRVAEYILNDCVRHLLPLPATVSRPALFPLATTLLHSMWSIMKRWVTFLLIHVVVICSSLASPSCAVTSWRLIKVPSSMLVIATLRNWVPESLKRTLTQLGNKDNPPGCWSKVILLKFSFLIACNVTVLPPDLTLYLCVTSFFVILLLSSAKWRAESFPL